VPNGKKPPYGAPQSVVVQLSSLINPKSQFGICTDDNLNKYKNFHLLCLFDSADDAENQF
jgi:hypothetical protein